MLVASTAAIGKDMAQPWEAADDLAQHQGRAVAVLNVGGVDDRVDQIALGIGKDVAPFDCAQEKLSALDLLARVIAARAATFRRFSFAELRFTL